MTALLLAALLTTFGQEAPAASAPAADRAPTRVHADPVDAKVAEAYGTTESVRPAAADTTEGEHTKRRRTGDHMLVSVTHSEETFASARSNWREDLLSVRLNASGMAAGQAALPTRENTLRRTVISFEGGRAERFGQRQGFGGFDYYRTIVARTYANLRLRFAPRARVIPEFDVLFEVTSGTRTGWEGAAGYRLMRYEKSSVQVYSAAVARYHGLWYFRARASFIPISGSMGTAVVLAARRYFRSGDELLEVVMSSGRELVTGAEEVVLDIRQSISGLVRFQYFLTRSVGVNVGASYTADGGLTRWGLIAGVQTRI